MIGDLTVPAGTYTLFVDISDPAQWVLIVSKETGEWGLATTIRRTWAGRQMTMAKPPAMVEDLKYTLDRQRRRQGHADAGLGET